MLHLATYTRDLFMDASMREKKEKKQHKEGFEPTMSGSQGKRSTIVLQMLPSHAFS